MIFRRVILQTIHITNQTRLLPLPHATAVHGTLCLKEVTALPVGQQPLPFSRVDGVKKVFVQKGFYVAEMIQYVFFTVMDTKYEISISVGNIHADYLNCVECPSCLGCL